MDVQELLFNHAEESVQSDSFRSSMEMQGDPPYSPGRHRVIAPVVWPDAEIHLPLSGSTQSDSS